MGVMRRPRGREVRAPGILSKRQIRSTRPLRNLVDEAIADIIEAL
jgi:hypothetical protein